MSLNTLSIDEVKDALKKISLCQPLNEHTITQELEVIYQFLKNTEEQPNLEMISQVVKHIIEFRQFTLNQKIANQIVMTSAKLALSQKEQIKAWDILKNIFEPEKQFYRYHEQILQDETRFSQHMDIDEEFCNSLIDGMEVDALKEDEKCTVISWSRGKIFKSSEKYIWVKWEGDETKRKIQRFSKDIAPYKTMANDDEWNWRHSLQQGDVIDCLDNRIWQNSTIIERFESEGIVEYTIGFRNYEENGNQLDPINGKRFNGWNSQYDERIKATSPRIRIKDTYAKSFCKFSSMNFSEETIQDCNDFIYPITQFGVPRFNTKCQRRSQVMIDLIQLFGEQGGFQYIAEQLEKGCVIDFVHAFMLILGNMHEMLHRDHVHKYVPKIWASLQENILNSPDNNLRNFSGQKIADILNGAGNLLKRVHSLKEKQELIDKFDMDIAFKCFSSDFLERKLQGLKAIQELIKKTKDYSINMDSSDIKFLSIQIMVDWLKEKKIFETLYVNSANSHLVQRSAEFFKFLLDEKLITQDHIKQIWNGVCKGETEHKLAIYKLFKDASSSLDKEQLDNLSNMICTKEPQSITKDDIELLTDLTRYNYRFKEEYCQRFADFYWELLISNKLNTVMTEQFISYYIEQVLTFEMRPHKSSQIAKIGKTIENGSTIPISLRVLMKFIEKLEIQPSSWDQYTRNVALTELEQNYKLVEVIIKSFQNLKEFQQEQEQQYIEEIRIRMQFIQFFYQNIQTIEYRLTFDIISTLWEQLVCQSKYQAERDIIYKWFSALSSQTPDGQSQLNSMVPVEDLKIFFQTKMTVDPQQLVTLTEEGFNCFKTVLQAINKQDSNMYGLDVLWLIVLDNENEKVSKQAMEYYHSFEQDLSYLFDQLLVNRENPKRLFRCLLVLEDFIDQSEIQGVGNLKSLNALSKGEEVTITVLNEHSTQMSVPKKIQFKINDNQTIIELRLAISKQIKASWDSIGLNCTKGEIKPTENGKMVKDLRHVLKETILCFKKNVKEIPEEQLIDENNLLTPKARIVFAEIFSDYSTDGKMTKEDCTKFVTGCTGNPCGVEDSNITKTFEQYDKDKDGILTIDDFIEFYTDSARSKKQTVWLNLQTLHYRNDLLRGDKVSLPQVDSSKFPRGLIVQNQQWLEILFSFLEASTKEVQEQTWYLLRRLPPSPKFVKQMLTFEGIQSPQDWDTILVNSNYRLLYSLYIIEFLMSSQDEEALLPLMQEQSDQLTQLRDKWMGKFLQLGGFDKLLSFFKYYQGKSVDTLNLIEKEILSFLLKTFSQYLIAACSIKVSNMYKAAYVISDNKSLDQILLQLRSQFEEPTEFRDLLQKLKESRLGESIIAKFEVEKFLGVLVQLIQDLLKANELESEERQIIEYSLTTVVIILLHNQELLNSNIENQDFINLLFSGIFTEKSQNIHNLFSRAILVMCHQSQAYNNQPTKIILEQLIKMQSEEQRNSAQYYELLCHLLDSAFESEETKQYIDYHKLSKQILNDLINHKSTETRVKNTPVDKVLVGLLLILQKLLPYIDEPIIDLLFNQCLYSHDKDVEIKCKSQESRAVTFQLLTQLSNNSQALQSLITNLYKLSEKIPSINKWNYIPASDMRSPTGYCGIRNLRCICYMNAMLQQFYMTPPFRYGIMHANDGMPQDIQVNKTGLEYDDNVLHQLQQMFAYLELSDRVDYNPQEFCAAFKDYAGEPVNIFIQQDAQEFLNMIFDKLENLLKDTAFKSILDGVYGGKTCTQIVCSECKYASSKFEQFYNVSLPIKNLKNLQECFEKYIQGEIIGDFKCDNCQKKVDVTKRQLLQQLPNVLILHLQRIVFNLDTFMNEKINSRLEFPMLLDLQDYVVQNDEKQQCTQYKLVGVVIHVGVADVGHYFSYIDINRDNNNQNESQWLEFNDSKIKDFKLKQLENECFGGQSGNDYTDNDVWGMGMRENSQNAYMLVYEKVEKDPITLVFKSEEELEKGKKIFNSARQKDELTLEMEYNQFKPYVPENLRTTVNLDNQQFLLERNLFNQDLMKFISQISDVIINEQDIDVKAMIEVLLRFNYDLLARAYDNNIMEQFSEKLQQLISKHPDDSYLDLVFYNKLQKVTDLLLVCPETRTRKYFSKLLVQLFEQQISKYKLSLNREDQEQINIKTIEGLDQMFGMIQEQVPKNWARFEQYFQFWLDIMNLDQVIEYLIEKQGLTYLIDFILDKHSPLNLYEKKHSIGNSYFQTNYSQVIQIITNLLQRNVKLSFTDKKLLYSYKFYDKMLKNNKIDDLIPIVIKFAYNNLYFSEIIAGCILRGFSSQDPEEFKNYLTLLKPYIKINDQYKQLRIEWMVGIPSAKVNTTNKVYDTVNKVPKIEVPSFGTYGLQGLDEDIFTFPCPLGWSPTLIDLFTQNKLQKNSDNICLLILKYLLMIAMEDEDCFNYIRKIPSTNYQYKSMDDIFKAFLETYIIDSKRFYSSYPRKQESDETQSLLDAYIHKTQQYQNEFNNVSMDFIVGKSIEISKLKRTFYLMNSITKEESHCVEDCEEYNTVKEQIEEGILQKIIILEEKTIKTYICDNIPTGLTNEALPQQYVKGTQFYNYQVDQNSPAANFIQSKAWSYDNQQNPIESDCEIKNVRQTNSVKQISVANNNGRYMHVVLSIKAPENTPHFVPQSRIQSLMSPKSSVIMFTAIKQNSESELIDLNLELAYKKQDNKPGSDGHVFLSTEEQMDLDSLHNDE